MSLDKKTKSEKERYLGSLQKAKRNIENGNNNDGTPNPEIKRIFTAYSEFLKMPYQKQLEIKNAWEKYYEDVKNSTSYALFQEQRKALEEGNIARVKELADDAKQMRINGISEELTKPSFIDPWEFSYGNIIRTYKQISQKIKELIEYPDVGVSEIFKE